MKVDGMYLGQTPPKEIHRGYRPGEQQKIADFIAKNGVKKVTFEADAVAPEKPKARVSRANAAKKRAAADRADRRKLAGGGE